MSAKVHDEWQTDDDSRTLKNAARVSRVKERASLPAASAINSLVQSASAASPRAMSPGVAAGSELETNSDAQSPERAKAATSGAGTSMDTVY